MLDKYQIRLTGKKDRNGNDYYFSTSKLPLLIDLSKTVIHFFPDEDPENPTEFGGDLVFRPYTGPNDGPNDVKENNGGRFKRSRKVRRNRDAEPIDGCCGDCDDCDHLDTKDQEDSEE